MLTFNATAQRRFWEAVARSGPGECWPWQRSLNRYGYGKFKPNGRHGGQISASRAAWMLSHPGVPLADGEQVCHTCDVRRCCNPAHLFVGTNADNTADRDRKGRTARGERHGRWKHGLYAA